ncbi:MAG: 3-deoxy-7-phosphoheptulonate synthase [Treponema sp.]|nr:3-deoxy-7-phosphoheptulonate synthase [Treponema sp.]
MLSKDKYSACAEFSPEALKKVIRGAHPEDSVVSIGTHAIGGGVLGVIAGPCAVENEKQIIAIAKTVKAAGASFLRGGAFKLRTNPYSFQGIGSKGIKLLAAAKKETGLPLVSEITEIRQFEYFDGIDIIQVGARNMQNFSLLKELGKCGKPVLLKRGLASTVTELLMAAEYIMDGGNVNVILCERGLRTFETFSRSTLDIAAVPWLKQRTHLPVIVDPSHAAGDASLIPAVAKAAVAAGADGLMIEVHNDPEHALCDGEQSLTPDAFSALMIALKKYAELEGKRL